MRCDTLDDLKHELFDFQEIEFTYLGVEYFYNKTVQNLCEGVYAVEVWKWGEPDTCQYKRIIKNGDAESLHDAVNDIVLGPILHDGKSITEAEKDIEVTFVT